MPLIKITVITTFHQKGFEEYGQKMLESCNRHLPPEVELVAYFENMTPEEIGRVKWVDLEKSSPELMEFKAQWMNDPEATGKTEGKLGFQWDAVRFSHKLFAVFHAAKNVDADILIWMDADTFCFKNIPFEELLNVLPLDGQLTSFLGRKEHYTECGFVAYNLRHPRLKDLLEEMESYYRNGKFKTLPQYHDCMIFDYSRKKIENDFGALSYNISWYAPKVCTHPFVNTLLGLYMDHLKGDRKERGQSFAADLQVKSNNDYWQRATNDGSDVRKIKKSKSNFINPL